MSDDEPKSNLDKIRFYFSVLGEEESWEVVDFERATKWFDFSQWEHFIPESLHYGGLYRGWEGYKLAVKRVWEFWGGIKVDLVELTSGGDYVIALLHISGIGPTGISFSFPAIETFKFRNGRCVELKVLWWDTCRARQCAAGYAPSRC